MMIVTSLRCLFIISGKAFYHQKSGRTTFLLTFIIETAKEHGLNVYKYLTYLFEHLPNVEFLMKPKFLEDFLPWAKNIQEMYKGI